ncbi:MAG: arylsulfatase [Candidatus Hydrogenedentota bacterium]
MSAWMREESTMRMNRREWLRSAGLAAGSGLVASACAGAAKAGASGRRPNIIYIMADDLGYGDLGCYGQDVIQTPRIDQLAEEGIRFTQCYAGSTVCAPSRCALMTGLHTGHCWIRGNARVPLRPEDVTVAELLKEQGYTTGLVGKWGLGNEETTGVPNKQGFDYFFGYLDQGHAHNYYPDHLWRNEERVELPENVQSETDKGVAIERETYSHDLFAQEALDFVNRHQDEPFFLYFALTTPHANNEGGRATGDGMEVPDYGSYAEKEWANPQKGHAAMITRMDQDVGRLMDRLKELGIDENTIVFFTSDNGPHREGGADPDFFDSNGPLKGIKRDLYEGGIRVPMIVRWPGTLNAGQTSDQVWAFWDFLPTAVELAGGEAPDGIDGMSMVQTLRLHGMGGIKPVQKQHEYLYWEFHEGGFKQGVRSGDWKAVRNGKDEPLELYDLSTDIGETNNVAEEHPDVIQRIEEYLKVARTDNEHWQVK